jgi:hypothetical protein
VILIEERKILSCEFDHWNQGDEWMLIWELELLEEILVSIILMFFAVAVSLVLTKIRDIISGRASVPQMDRYTPALINTV